VPDRRSGSSPHEPPLRGLIVYFRRYLGFRSCLPAGRSLHPRLTKSRPLKGFELKVNMNHAGEDAGAGGSLCPWFIGNLPQAKGQASTQLVMDQDHTVLAQYSSALDGDANDDCVVNILDLIYVRNRMSSRCEDSD